MFCRLTKESTFGHVESEIDERALSEQTGDLSRWWCGKSGKERTIIINNNREIA
jgi:hypothetical protein